MATLSELKQIQINSTRDPGGDPDVSPPIPPDPDIVAARDLLGKIEAALWSEARIFLAGALPTDPNERNEAIAWAQDTISNSAGMAQVVLRLALVGAPPAATVDQILTVADDAIITGIRPLIRLLAKGRHPGRR